MTVMSKNSKTNKKKQNKVKIALVILLSMMVLAAATVLVAFRIYLNKTKAVSDDDTPIGFTVYDDSTVYDVVHELYEEELIQNEFCGKVFVKLHSVNGLYAGNYILRRSMSMAEIMEELSDENNAIVDTVTVTIVDGDWAKDIAKRIAKATNLKEDRILERWDDINYISKLIDRYECLSDEIFASEHVYLEGYLMPETYYFYKTTTVEQVTEKMLDQTEALYQKYKTEIKNSGYTFHQLITLASVVQFEAGSNEDIKMIAGVLLNRLDDDWMLQCSATLCYAIYSKESQRACETAQNVNSKYNTYKYTGLPVGPICNPYRVAIEACIIPERNDYFYFCADAKGNTYYAKTLDEHNRNVNKYVNY